VERFDIGKLAIIFRFVDGDAFDFDLVDSH
jgi:hypothetical protein